MFSHSFIIVTCFRIYLSQNKNILQDILVTTHSFPDIFVKNNQQEYICHDKHISGFICHKTKIYCKKLFSRQIHFRVYLSQNKDKLQDIFVTTNSIPGILSQNKNILQNIFVTTNSFPCLFVTEQKYIEG